MRLIRITKKQGYTALLASCIFFLTNNVFAQLSGIKTIPTDYASVAAFVTDVNTQGVGAGGVTLNVPAAYTETLTGKITLTATGTAANPIIIQKSGAGANPKLISYVGTVATPSVVADGFFVLAGSDYVTIDGIDLQESAANTTTTTVMEFGYGLFLASATNGSQNNTIQNCVITLNRLQNTGWTAPGHNGSTGIAVLNGLATASGAVTITAASGSNSNNKFYSNTIQNCNAGLVFIGFGDVTPYALSDSGNDVGGLSASTGNNILNFGGGATTQPATGIFINNQYGFNASYNTINNNNGTGVNHATTLRGIFANISSNGASMNLNNNTITLKSAVTTSQVSAIECSAGSTGTGNTININNNTITGCTNDLATTSIWYGIYNTGTPANLNVNNNTFSNNSSKVTTGTTYLIYNIGAVTATINMNGNNLSHAFNHTATQGGTINYVRNNAGSLTGTLNMNNNSFASITHAVTSTTAHYFVYNASSQAYTNINNNNWNNLTINSSGGFYLMWNSSNTQIALNVNNNAITTGLSRGAAPAGTLYCYYAGSSSLGTSTQTISNNNFSNITATTAGTGLFYGIYTSDGAAAPYPKKEIFNNTFNNINYNASSLFYGLYVSYLGDGTSAQGSRVYNNVFSNISGGFSTSYIIYPAGTASATQPAKFYGNSVLNYTSTNATGSVYGIYASASTTAPYVEIYNNKIAGLTSATTTGKVFGFYGIGLLGSTMRVHNNYFGGMSASGALTTTMPAPAMGGMWFSSTGAYKIYNNTIYLNATSTGANFSTAGIYTTQTGAGNVDFRNNNVVNTSTATGTGFTIGLQANTISTTPYANTSNNNNWFVGTASTVNVTYYNGTVSAGTVANMAALTLTDGSSVAVAPTFLSTAVANANYLHIDATVPTQIESGGQNMPTFFTTDFDGDIRAGNTGYTGTGGTYDIGADEFNGVTPAPLITALVSTPALSQSCITAPRTITCSVTTSTGTITGVMLGYSFNGVAQTPVVMTNTSGSTWSGVIPASTPVNATVFWAISATGSNGIITNLSGTYADEPLLGVTAIAANTGSPICAGTATGLTTYLSANLPATTAPANYLIPIVTVPLSDEDLGSVIITQGATTILSNTTTGGNLIGTIGTATGTIGSFSDFTSFGPYAMTAGSTYNFSVSSITQNLTNNYNNSMAIFIDYNRNGSFTDAGELVYAAGALVSGAHTETGTFTIPATALNGLTRMRVFVRETTLTTAYINTFAFGEFEDYMLNISSTNAGGGNPPAITSVSWASSTVPAYATGNPATINPTVTDNYIATVTSLGCTVISSPTTVNINALPAAPIATNSSQCGTSAPTASVATGAGTAGNGQFYWYSAATAGNLLQAPPVSAYTTFYSNDFTNLTIGAGATLSGVASLSAVAGKLRITPNSTNQLGGITVDAGVNAQVYKVDFDVTTTPIGGADGFSYSFGDDVNAASTAPPAEMGSGTKLKISFDAYGVMPNGSGIYVLYNNTATSFNATTPGVLAYVANTSWVGSADNHVTVDINAQGGLTLTLNGVVLMNNVALPSAYVYADKSTWKHVIAGRTGSIAMQMVFDNLVIQTASQLAGSTTYGTPISTTTTFYVSEVGTNGCVSPTAPVLVTVSQPDPIAVTSGVSPAYCLGQSFTSTASSLANPAYTYEWDIATYTGTGMTAPVIGASLTTTPTVAGVYPFTVTGTNGICTEVKTVNVTINALPVITTATATPSPACHDSQVALNASSIVSGPQTLPAGYCSTINSGSGLMNQVTFGSINNNSLASNPTASPYYTNYNLTTNVQPGQTLPLTIVNGTSAAIISVWIDYNRDGQLAASEWQQVALAAAVGATVSINITIPANAQMGLTKMRIRSRLSGNLNGSGDACTTLGSGETEDYLVNIQSQPAVPYSYTWNSTPVINTLTGSTLVTNVTSAPVTQTWTITATEAATGCVNSLTTAPVTINQFFTAPTATSSAHCGVQVPTAVVVDGNAFTAPVYNWYTVPTGGTAVQATTSATITSAVSTTTTYYVSTTNPATGCESARTPVTVTVSAPPALALSNATATNCSALASPVVTLASGGSSFDNFTWSPSATVSGTSAAGYTFNPTNLVANSPATTTTYTLTAAQTTGALCVNTTSIVVSTNALPLITSTTAGPAATCAGTTVNLAAASSTFAPLSATIGCNSGATTSTSYPSPFGNFYYGAKQQFLFTAAEFQAAGLVAGNISSVAFNVTVPMTTPLTDYTIYMKNTTVTALTTTFETGLTTVFYSPSFTPTGLTGYANNTINFNVASFPWDGTSNVVVEICFNNVAPYTTNAGATYCTTFAGAAHYYQADAAGVCATVTNGTLTANRTDMMFGGTTGTNWTPTLAWSWPAQNINGATNTTTAVNAGTTNIQSTYTVQATNTTTGCSNTATTAPITIYALPQIGAGNDILMCTNNGSQDFTPTGTGAGVNGTYTWNNGAINGTPFTVTQTTQFVVTGVDANTCVNYDTLQVVFSTVPPVNAGVDQQICIGQTASLPATGFAPYSWNTATYPGSGISAPVVNPTLVVTPTTPGVYTYTVGVGNSVGCTNEDQVQLTVWALPLVNAGVDQTICNASPAIVSGSGALTYTWTNNVTNATAFFPSSTATYTVDGVDINGCHNVDEVVVTVLPQPIVNGGIDQTICATTPAILFAQTTANTPTAVTGFQWNNSVTNGQQFTPTATATYTVTATGANGCTNQDQVVVNVLALPNVNAGNDITVCAGLNATLNATGAVSYSWNNGITQAIPFYPNATTTYTVTGTGANGCSNQDQVVVNVSTGPNVTVTPNQIVCANAAATLSATSTNSMGGFWTTSNGLGTISPNVSNGTVTYVPTTNDPVVVNLTYVASNACGNASQSTSVTVLPIPTVNAGPDIASCSGLPVTLTATSNGFISWNNNVSNNVAFVPSTSATYTVTAVGANNCSNSDQMVLTVLALPDVNAGADQTICSGTTATLNGTGANTYLWNNGVVNSVAFAPTSTQTYTVTGTALNGCQSSDQVLVTVNATPVALVSVVDGATVAASPAGMNYQWINCASGTDIPTATAAQFTATANGSYAVIVTSLQGCEDVSDCITISSVGLDQMDITDMNVFPNPTNGEVNVSIPESVSVNVSIFDAQGKLVAEQMNVTNNGKLNISNVTPGVYMVRLTAENAVQTFRVVKN
jgi:hypothetical protein